MELEEFRRRWIADKPLYEKVVEYLKNLLNGGLHRAGIYGHVSGRPKEVDSLLKKVMRKGYKYYDDVKDKAGVRVVVRFPEDAEAVGSFIQQAFTVLDRQDRRECLGSDRFGYLGVHYDVELHDGEGHPAEFFRRRIEIQVQTSSQALWADIDHELRYKSELSIPLDVQRRLICLSAVVEMADREFARLKQEIHALPNAGNFRVLSALERQYFKLTSREYDKELSLEVITLLAPLYSASILESAQEYFDEFYRQNGAKLAHVFKEYAESASHSPLLFQPEILMVFDRLDTDEFMLVEAWARRFPVKELQDLALAWGKTLHY
jgi:putative GTP pyrophosphokinase